MLLRSPHTANMGRMKTPVLIFTFMLLPFLCFASEPEKQDPIDVAMDKAMDSDPSTAGQIQAVDKAQQRWDKEMNIAYHKLQKAMEKEEWAALQASQQAWLVYRDKELKTLEEIFNRMQGTMYGPVAAYKAMKLTRDRTLVLRGYLDVISER